MRFLIDGYNLLHATDLFGTGESAGTLQGSRDALLGFLAAALSASERRATTIVFDAAGAPPGLPNHLHHEHIAICYARDYADADTLIEEMIEDHRAPRGLLVVSSDHRVQRAARHRGAKYIDSQTWYAQLARKSKVTQWRNSKAEKTSGGSVAYWVKQFADLDMADLSELLANKTSNPPKTKRPNKPPQPAPTDPNADNPINPFPPGYADDLLEDEM